MPCPETGTKHGGVKQVLHLVFYKSKNTVVITQGSFGSNYNDIIYLRS